MAPAAPLPGPLPGPAPVLFFAPDQARRRLGEWGATAFQTRVADAMRRFLGSAARWLRIIEGRGPAALESTYRAIVGGQIDPAEGHVIAL